MHDSTSAHLSDSLQSFLTELNGKDTTIGALVELIGDRGFGFLLLLLALPAALPLPAPGYATPFGVVMIVLGIQMVAGRTHPWVPRFLAHRKIPFALFQFSVRNAKLPLRVVELFIRPRLRGLARHRLILPGLGLAIITLASMMSIPIPLTNTAPSFVIFMIAAGLIEEDGLFLLGGILLAPVAGALAGTAIYMAWLHGPAAVEDTIKPLIKGFLGLSG